MATKHLKNDRHFLLICLYSLIIILVFPWWSFLNFPTLWKWFWLTFCRGKIWVVQTVSPLSRVFLFLTIKLNCSDRIFPKTSTWKVVLVSQNVQNFKIYQRKCEKIHCWLYFFWLCWRPKISGKTYDFMWAYADYYNSQHQHACYHKTIGSHLKKSHQDFSQKLKTTLGVKGIWQM